MFEKIRNLAVKSRNKSLSIFGDILLNKHFPWIPYYKPEGYRILGSHIRKLIKTLKPGDVLLRGYSDYLDGLFIGHWSHAALVMNDTKIVHSMAEGVSTIDYFDFLKCDRVMVLRPTLDEEDMTEVLSRAKEKIGTPYDFGFDFTDPKEMSCTEFVYHSFEPFTDKLGLFREEEKFFFIKRQTVRPELFTKFFGFEKKLQFPI